MTGPKLFVITEFHCTFFENLLLLQINPHKSTTNEKNDTECARDRDLYEFVSCCKFVNDILFVSVIKNNLSYLGASCPRCDFVLVP